MPEAIFADAVAVAEAIRARRASPVEVVRHYLDRIKVRDVAVRAWAHLDPDHALAAARALPAEPAGPLHGVPVGFKDIVDTADMPTAYGSPIYVWHRPARDAACVAMTRAAGGIVLGKAETTEFAGRRPGKTAHPLDSARTPGGSSSGSAAAVGDDQVPLAVGSQTAGSTIRPAAYCGVHALKPTFQSLPFAGMKHLAERLDTIGLMGCSVRDLGLFRAALAGLPFAPPQPAETPVRIGLCRTPFWERVNPAMRTMVEAAADAAASAGHAVEEVAYPDRIGDPEALCWAVVHAEMTRQLAVEVSFHPAALSDWVHDAVAHGRGLAPATQADNLRRLATAEAAFDAVFANVDVVLAPAALGAAPVGLEDTGSPVCNIAFHIAGLPAVSLPWTTDAAGLPLGLQLVGPRFADARLLDIAAALERLRPGR